MNNAPAPGSRIPPPGGTRLITVRGTKVVNTARRETDARTALARGLQEYMQQMVGQAPGGREIRFAQVFDTWASPEDKAEYPAACVHTEDRGHYDAHSMSPTGTLNKSDQIPEPDGRYLVKTSEFMQRYVVEVRCTDVAARKQLCAMLETAFNPVDWMYGFILMLPHYFGQHGVYELQDMHYEDSEENVIRNFRIAKLWVDAHLPVLNLTKFPDAIVKTRVETVGADVIVNWAS